MAISTFTGGSRTTGPTGGDYFIGFITILIAAGWVIAALGDFFILTKVSEAEIEMLPQSPQLEIS